MVEVKVSTVEIIRVATISHDVQTCWDEDVNGNADSRQQQRSCHTGPASNDLEEQIDHDLGWHLDGRVDEVCEKHVQAEPGDVQADAIVGGGDSKPTQTREGGGSEKQGGEVEKRRRGKKEVKVEQKGREVQKEGKVGREGEDMFFPAVQKINSGLK